MEKKLYEDENVIVIHKRAGMASQTSRVGEKDLVSEISNYVKRKTGNTPDIGLINRLDQPVEGLVMFGLNKKATAILSEQLQSGDIEKHYYAGVLGIPATREALVVDYVRKGKNANISEICEPTDNGAQKAVLEYKIIKENTEKDLSILDVHLITGRHHQIRLQMSAAGYPLLGDKKYGNEVSEGISEANHISKIALCAYSLAFNHPVSGERIEVNTTPEGEWFRTI